MNQNLRPNLYPRNLENITAVLEYYFPNETHSIIDELAAEIYDKRKMELNRLEFASKIATKNKDLLGKTFKIENRKTNIKLFVSSIYEALFIDESKWSGSSKRKESLTTLKNNLKY